MGEQDRPDGNPAGGAPDPDALLPEMDGQQLNVLRRVGREWERVCAAQKFGGVRSR